MTAESAPAPADRRARRRQETIEEILVIAADVMTEEGVNGLSLSEVARRLGIGRSTLYRKLEALGLNSERSEDDSDAVAAERQPRKFA